MQTLIVDLVNNVVTPENFQNEVQNHIQFSLKQVENLVTMVTLLVTMVTLLVTIVTITAD